MMYHVFLIMTDNCIDDYQETKDLIVEASTLPLSIIIVGVGNEKMLRLIEEFDGDH